MTHRPQRPGTHDHIFNAPRTREMLRVDHAGEFAAVAIYKAQAKIFGRSPKTRDIAAEMSRMQNEEQEHLDTFSELLRKNEARPTAMLPLWSLASTALGASTALMGEKAAHACTEAVETVIEQHYAEQISETQHTDPELAATFTKFRDDELRHRDFAVEEGAKEAPAYPLLTAVIKAGCRAAIKISEKI
ncbi:MAG TPA: demethoxyubiquinone hydroxylase family protein [Hellea balneolensis]|uniref:3-demethoxyubiquinol 3-hydroxylase n=1 Tax=Hellea balneolensis TaxID=287478 RepID=A0A7C5QX85_9PROT|nr:demethoxyubiquinone hydroxylase family protein [Hellea balneolensis]